MGPLGHSNEGCVENLAQGSMRLGLCGPHTLRSDFSCEGEPQRLVNGDRVLKQATPRPMPLSQKVTGTEAVGHITSFASLS